MPVADVRLIATWSVLHLFSYDMSPARNQNVEPQADVRSVSNQRRWLETLHAPGSPTHRATDIGQIRGAQA
jgi:hypothetical protein